MAISIINLNKLLRLCALPKNELITELRSDLRSERDKVLGKKSRGGHFQHPWLGRSRAVHFRSEITSSRYSWLSSRGQTA